MSMKTEQYKYLTKAELQEANRLAIKAGGRAIEPDYLERLPDAHRFPVFFALPWERHGWVRCQIGTATDTAAHDYMPVWLDVPNAFYDHLASITVKEAEEVSQ
jgi:hypothetical protein